MIKIFKFSLLVFILLNCSSIQAKGILLDHPSNYAEINAIHRLIRYGERIASKNQIEKSLNQSSVQENPSLYLEFQILQLYWYAYYGRDTLTIDRINQTIDFAKVNGKEERLADIYYLKGTIAKQLLKGNETIASFREAIRWAEEYGEKDKVLVYQAHLNDAIEIYRYHSANEFYPKNVLPLMEVAIQLMEKKADTLGLSNFLPRYTEILRTNSPPDSFNLVLNQWETVINNWKDERFKMLYHSKRSSYYKAAEELDKAIEQLHQAHEISKNVGFKGNIYHYYLRLNLLYAEKNQFEKALSYIDSAHVVEKIEGRKVNYEVQIHYHYEKIYEAMGDSDKALEHFKLWKKWHLEELKEQSVQNLTEWEAKFNLQEKENFIAQQTARNQSLRSIVGFSTFGLLMIALAFWSQLKAKKKLLKQQNIISTQAKELAALDEVKSRFFANITHELRTPLTLMLGPIQSVLKKESLSQQGVNLLDISYRNGNNLLKLINEILALTKLEHKKIALVEKPLLLFPFLNKITSSFESYAEMNGVQLDLDYQLDETLKILTDAGKVETIINNFLSNALKFTPNKGEIQVKVSTDTNQVLIEVIDTGQGIEKEDLPYVFDRFFQSKNKEIANSNGLGIGLALSNEFAKVLGGKLSVQSETGKGSCFQLAFPLKRTMEEIEEKERIQGLEAEKIVMPIKENLKVSEEKTAAKTFKILLVEDNVDLQHYLQTILAPLAAVKIAANGQIAWELLMTGNTAKRAQKEAFFPDLILSDLMMPTMNGYELLKKVKSNDAFSHIPFLMLTARGGLDDKLTALRIGVDDYLTKPFEEEELVLRIQNLLKVVKSRVLINKEAEKAEDKATELIYTVADQEWLSNLEKVVLENFKYTNFAVDQLAKLLHISKRNLHYKIKKLTGKTPAQYIQEARLATARKLLESKSKKTVKEVMYEVGLKDSSHFSKNFKKRYGKSPSSFL